MPAQTISINGIAYASKDVEVTMLGRIVRGITELNFNQDEDVEKIYVLGTKKAVGRTTGKEDCKGDVTLLVNEVAGIEVAADGTILDVGEFPITVVYKALPIPLKQTLTQCKFVGKALQVTGGSAAALAYKCNLDVMDISPLKPL